MRFNIYLLMSLLFIFEMEAQNNTNKTNGEGFKLEVSIPTQKNKLLYLGQYWKDKTYAIDSVLLSDEGKGIFSRSEEYPEGQYFLHIKPSFQADFLIGDDQHDIKMQLNEFAFANNRVTGSKDTEILWEYLAKTNNYNTDIRSLKLESIDTTLTQVQLDNKTQEIKDIENKKNSFEKDFLNKHKDTWAGKLITGLIPVELPYPQPRLIEEYLGNKKFAKDHFFDNIDLTDIRFWHTNYLDSYIDTYLKDWIDPTPDSVALAACNLVEKTKGNDICFKEMLSKLFNKYITSRTMGDENVWAMLYERYIKDNNISWIDDKQYAEINHAYELIKNNRIGMNAPNIGLEDLNDEVVNTNAISADYLVLYFYDPHCGYCKTETPKMHDDLYKKYKDKGLKVVAINTASNKQEWADFVNTYKLNDWINASDLNYKSQYWLNYDLSGIPMTYLLDKNKKIIAKKIDSKQLDSLLEIYLGNKDGTN